jgi:hypothetical protein
LLLTNDPPQSFRPASAEQVKRALASIQPTARPARTSQLLNTVSGLVQSEGAPGADIWYYSDFQRSSFPSSPQGADLKQIKFHGVRLAPASISNVYIDTAMLGSPVLQAGASNNIIVRTRLAGTEPKVERILQLSIDGQLKSATTLSYAENAQRIDTLSFAAGNSGWQRIQLTLNDDIRYDDTFRLTARTVANLSVLVLYEGQPNPYIQTAFRAYEGYQLLQEPLGSLPDLKEYSLIILSGVTGLPEGVTKALSKALDDGQSICIFPGKTSNTAALAKDLASLADVRIGGLVDLPQAATSLQPGADLVRDVFERIPDNIQLPTATWHYTLSSGLSANGQTVLGFRNGDPLLAQYHPSNGKLYICATGADLNSGNFTSSPFFVPFLYQMATQSKGSNSYAWAAGSSVPLFVPVAPASGRNLLHVRGPGIDAIPAQRANGAGVDVYLNEALQQPGFYTLSAEGTEPVEIGVNGYAGESELSYRSMKELRQGWAGPDISWEDGSDASGNLAPGQSESFPLWKVCIILALIWLAAETWLIVAGGRQATAVPGV